MECWSLCLKSNKSKFGSQAACSSSLPNANFSIVTRKLIQRNNLCTLRSAIKVLITSIIKQRKTGNDLNNETSPNGDFDSQVCVITCVSYTYANYCAAHF